MEQNIIDLIKSLAGKAESFHSLGEVESSKIAQAAETLGVEFAKDFVEYTQTFGAIELNYEEYCGVDETNYISTVQCTQDMREISDFPKDCYVIHSLGIDNIVDVQKSDGKIYQYAPGCDLELLANSLGEFLLDEFEGREKNKDDKETTDEKPDNDSKNADAENYYKKGRECFRMGQFQKAVSYWRKAGELGHSKSLNELGCSYDNGEGVQKNQVEAAKLYRMAAELGDADGQYNLGYDYENGIGVKQDYEAAIEWYTKAAEQGHTDAFCNLGVLYHNGTGVPQDYKKAAYWYEKAIAKGDAHSMNNMGMLYYMEKDYAKAAEWFEKAANLNDSDALPNIGYMYGNGYGVEQNYDTAFSWYTKGAYKDNAVAQNNLGDCYEHGYGVPVNFKKAVYWYTKAADNGNEEARKSLQTLRKDGYFDQSFEWFTKAFERGDTSAAYDLAVCYEKGKGVAENKETATDWYLKANELGDERAKDAVIKLNLKQTDPSLGVLTYNGDFWTSKTTTNFNGMACELAIELEGSFKDKLSDEQRKAYAAYQEKKDAFFESVLAKAKLVYNGANGETDNEILPKTLYIDRQGNYGWTCYTAWNDGHISAILSDGDVQFGSKGVVYNYGEVVSSRSKNEWHAGECVYVNLFGELQPLLLRRADPENFKDEKGGIGNGKLTDEENDIVKWLINDLKTEDIADEVLEYCNDIYENMSFYDEDEDEWTDGEPIEKNQLLEELDITKVYLCTRGSKKYKSSPDISLAGECSCDDEHGIAIGFRNKKFLAVGSEDFAGF